MASDQPEPNPTPAKEKPVVPQKRAAPLQNFPAVLAGFLLELIIPSFVALALLYYLSGVVNLWTLDRNLALVIAIVFLVVVCLILSYAIDAFLRGLRRGPPATGKKRAAQYRLRLIRFVLGGLLIPLGLMAAANFSMLPNGSSLMDYYILTISNPSDGYPDQPVRGCDPQFNQSCHQNPGHESPRSHPYQRGPRPALACAQQRPECLERCRRI